MNSFSYLTELWDNPFAVQLLYCSWTITDYHLCQLDYRLSKYRKYIIVLCMLYILGLLTFCLLLICNSQVPIKRLLCLGTAKAVLFLSVVRVYFFLATQTLWNALRITLLNLHATNTNNNNTIHLGGRHLLQYIQHRIIYIHLSGNSCNICAALHETQTRCSTTWDSNSK